MFRCAVVPHPAFRSVTPVGVPFADPRWRGSATVHIVLLALARTAPTMQENDRHTSAPPLLDSNNAHMARATAVARQVAASNAAVLITGESGTGKRVLARAIHAWSPRATHPFVIARPARGERQVDGEVMVYFEQIWRNQYRWLETANGGTLFLEDVGELPVAQQAILARALDERGFECSTGAMVQTDIRVIAATHRDLDADMHAGRFREDLYFRLSTVSIDLPPLRRRPEDLLRLAEYLLARLAMRYQRGNFQLSPEVCDLFARYPWPGNVRELEGVLERGVVLSPTETITPDVLPERFFAAPDDAADAAAHPLSLRTLEREQIEIAIRESPTLEAAALRLGIDPATLWRKRKRYHLD